MPDSRSRARAAVPPAGAADRAVIVVGDGSAPPDLIGAIESFGYVVVRAEEMALARFLVLAGGVAAVVLDARRLDVRDSIALEEVRRRAPSVAVVVVSPAPTTPEMKRALECGATTFLPWPSPLDLLGSALRASRLEP